MKIIYTLPSIATPHGGYRIVLEHLHNLQRRGHDVMLFIEQGSTTYEWYGPNEVFVTRDHRELEHYDVIVIGSPHSIVRGLHIHGKRSSIRVFGFMQMAEHMFKPNDLHWRRTCARFYTAPFPIIHGSHWGERICQEFGRTAESIYLTNSVNLDHFPEYNGEHEPNTILIEGWESSNEAKDTNHIGPQVAKMLKEKYKSRIIAYGFQPNKTMISVPDEYYCRPSLQQINKLYERATFLLKATRYDATALSPMEAAVKGCPTVRAIIEGDDWLINEHNCMRTGYTVPEALLAATGMLYSEASRKKYITLARQHIIGAYNWDFITDQLLSIFTNGKISNL